MRALPSWVKGLIYSFLCIFTLAQTGFGQGPAAASAYGKLPLSFEPNQGQTAGEVQFLSRGRGYTLLLNSSDSVLALHRGHRGTRAERMEAAPSADIPAALRMRLVGANRSAPGIAEDALPGKSNYLIGNDRSQWRTDVPNYGRVRYRGVYPGVDLVYYGNQRLLEHDFEVAPGADPRRIRLAFDGIQRAVVEKSGDLVLHLADGEVRLQKPLIYQNTEAGRREVTGGFVLRKNQVTIQVGSYDRRRALVIDPVLSYSTYLGGTSEDAGSAVATDSSGNVYVVGKTASTAANGFPIKTQLSATGCAAVAPVGCSGALDDVFITKIDPAGTGGTAGTALVYSTFLGGNGDDEGYGISVDSGNNAYVTGYTSSSDFPLAGTPYQAALGSGLGNAFVSKINSAGNALIYSTYLGGTARDWGNAITQDSGGNIYLTGPAFSRDFPTLSTLSAPPVTVFASRNSGTSWAAATSGITSFQITAFAVDGNTPGTVYAGQVGSGVIKSTDFGATWTAPEPTKSYTNALILDRTTTGAAAVLYEGSRFGGVRKITGGGTSSAFINSGLGNTNVLSLVQDATSAGTLYAGTNGSGVWVNTTINTTPTWSQKPTTGLGDTVINALAVDASDNLYAGTNSGVYELASGAATWTTVAGGPAGFVVTALAVDSSSNVYAATFGGGLFKLSGGAWTALNGSGGTALGTLVLRAVAVDPVTPSTIYAAGRSNLGLYKSTDGGATWSLLSSGLTITNAQALAIDPAAPANVYAGMVNLMSFVAKFNSGGSPAALTLFGGGSGSTQPYTIAVDNPTSQNMYIAGSTSTATLPTPLVGQTTIGGNTDGFVAKISTVGTPAVVWDRYLGGAFDDVVYSLALDQNGNVDVTGYTTSADFPFTANAYQTALKVTPNLAANAFVTEINPGGDTLLYSTYFGGTGGDDEGTGIAVVSAGSVASINVTNGGSGYTSAPAVTISGGGGSGAAATAAFSGGVVTGITVTSPGSGYVSLPAVAITGGGGTNATAQAVLSSPLTPLISVAGLTFSTDLPTVNPLQAFNAGSYDTFYARFDPSKSGASGLLYSTYLGGNSDDFGFFVNNLALDPLGAAWITGETFSTNFPLTASNAVQPAGSSTVANSSDAFVYKIQTTGNASDVAVSLSSGAGATPAEGTTYTYNINVNNFGPNPAGAPSVVVSGAMPTNLTVNSVVAAQGTCSGLQTFTCSLGTVAVGGGAVTITVNVTANTVATPPVGPTKTITVSVSTADDDPAPANNSASTTVTVQRRADLTITGISSPASVTNGTAFNYSITAANNGPSTATGIIVSYTPPASVTFNSAASTAGCALSAGTVTCPVVNLTPFSSTVIVINVTPHLAGSLSATFTVSSPQVVDDGPSGGPGTNNTPPPFVLTVKANVNLAVTLSTTSPVVPVGGSAAFNIAVKNNGVDTATGVSVTGSSPADLLYVSFSSSSPGVSCSVAGAVTCTLPDIPSAGTVSLTILARAVLQGTYVATASATSSGTDANSADNSASTTVTVIGAQGSNLTTLLTDYETGSLQSYSGIPNPGPFGQPTPVGASPGNVVIAPNGRLAFTANVNGSYISVVDLTIQAEIARIRNVRASSLDITADGQKLVAVGQFNDELDVVDIATLAVTRISLDGKVGDAAGVNDIGPFSLAVVGDTAYIANTFGPVIVVNFATPGSPVITTVAGTAGLLALHAGHQVAATPDGSTVAVFDRLASGGAALIYLINTSTNTLSQTVTTAFGGPRTIAIARNTNPASGVVAFLGFLNGTIRVLDLRTGSGTFGQVLAGSLTLGSAVTDLALTPDGNTLQAVNGVTQGVSGPQSLLYTLNAQLLVTNPATALQSTVGIQTSLSVRGLAIGYVQNFPLPSAPQVNDVVPQQITNEAPKLVQIFGDNFAPGALVRIGNLEPLPSTFVSPQEVTVTVPAGAAVQTGNIVVTLPNSAAGPLQANVSGGGAFGGAKLQIDPPATFAPLHPVAVSSFTVPKLSLLFRDFALLPGEVFSPSVNISSDGLYAYSGQLEIGVTNLDTAQISALIVGPTSVGGTRVFSDCNTGLDGYAIAPDPTTGKKVLHFVGCDAATESSDTLYFVDVDPTSGTRNTLLARTIQAPNTDFRGGQGLAATPDGRFVYSADFNATNGTRLVIFDVLNSTSTIIADITTLGADLSQQHIHVTPDGHSLLLSGAGGTTIKVYDIQGVNATAPVLVTTITGSGAPTTNPPLLYWFQVVGTRLFAYASDQRYVQVFNFDRVAPNFAALGSYTIPSPAGRFSGAAMAVSPEGTLIYAVLENEDAVAVLDANLVAASSPNSLITKMRTMINPANLAFSPRGNATADLQADIAGTGQFQQSGTVFAALNQPFEVLISVQNNSPATASGVNMTLAIPAGVVANSAIMSDGSIGNVACTISASQVVCPVGVFHNSDFASILVNLTASSLGPLVLTNTVSGNELDPNPANNAASLNVTVQNGADLAITGSVSANPAVVGSPNTATVVVTNNGPDLASSVNVVLTSTAQTAYTFTTTQGTCTPVPGVVSCTLGDILPAGQVTITATATYSAGDASSNGAVILGATVFANSADPNFLNNVFSINLPITSPAGGIASILVTERGIGQLRIYNPSTNTPVGQPTTVIATPIATALSPNRRLAFVASLNVNAISVADLSIQKEIYRIRGVRAANIAITADGTRLVAPLQSGDAVAIIDAATFQVLQTVNLNGLVGDTGTVGDIFFGGMVMVGSKAYIDLTVAAPTTVNPVVMIDAAAAPSATPVLVTGMLGQGAGNPGGSPGFSTIAATPDGLNVLAVRNVSACGNACPLQIISTTSNSVVGQVVTSTGGAAPVNIASKIAISPSNPNGAFGYYSQNNALQVIDLRPIVGGVANPNFGKVLNVAAVNLPFGPGYLSVSSDGNTVYATTNNGLSQFDFVSASASLLQAGSPSSITAQMKLGAAGIRPIISALIDALPEAGAPQVSSVQPGIFFNDTPTTLTISGSGFASDARVKVGTMDSVPATFISSSQLQVTVPAGAPAQSAVVIVTNPNSAGPIAAQWLSSIALSNSFDNGNTAVEISEPLSYQPKFDVVSSNFGDGTVSLLLRKYNQPVAPTPMGIAFAPDGSEFFVESLYLPEIVAGGFNSSQTTINFDRTAGAGQAGQQEGIAVALNPATGQSVAFAASATLDANTGIFGERLNLIDANPFSPSYNTIIDSISAPALNTSAGRGALAATTNGLYVYEQAFPVATVTNSIVVFNVAGRSVTSLDTGALQIAPQQAKMVVTTDNHWLLMQDVGGSVRVFDISTTPAAPASVGVAPASTPAGKTAPVFTSFAVAGSHLYAYDGNQNLLEVFNFNPGAGSFAFVNYFVVPGPGTLFYAGLAVASDESYIYVTVPESDSVVVLDAAKVIAGDPAALVTSFATGLSPQVVALSPKRRDTAPQDVAITISHTPESVVMGSTITYNVTLTDFGPFPGSGNGDSGGDSGGFLINLDKSLVPVSSTFFNSPFLGCSLAGNQLLCDFGHGGPDLGPPPVSISGNLVMRTTALGPVTVQGYIQAGKNSYDPNSANNTAIDTANVVTGITPPAIAKAFGAASIPLNGSTSLTFTIQNNNTASTLTGVGFSDTMPASLVISTPNGLTGTCGGGTISATQGTSVISLTGATLAQSSSCTFSVNVIGTAAGTQNNTTGTVTSTEGGTGGTASASINVVAPPSIAKAFNPTAIPLNGTTTLTFTITNPAGNAVAQAGVAFTDTLPTGLVVASPNGLTSTCGGTATAVEGSGSISLTGGAIATGSNCTITANVTATSVGSFTNTTGNVSSTNGGTGNTASANLSVAAPPAITKAFGAASIPLNGSTSLTFTIANPETNAIALTGVAFTDNLPAGLVVATPNALASTCGGTATAVAGASSLSLAGVTLARNASCTISANVTGTTAGLKNNSVQATATESGAGNASLASVTVIATDLAVTMTAAPAIVAPGSNLTYTITVTNNGPSDSTGYNLTDTLPSGVTFVSATSGCVLTTVLTCTGPSLGAGLTATYVVVVTPTALGTLSNTASVTGNDPDSVSGNNSATTTTSVAAADLSVTKTASAPTVALAANLTYTITVTNTGPSASTGYAVTDALPSTATFVSATSGCVLSTVLTCTGSSLGIGQSATFTVVVTPTALGTLTNTATVVGIEPDLVSGNNSGTSTVTVVTALADVAVTMTAATSPVAVLGSVTYQITLSNSGPSTATGVVLTDTLPAGTLFAAIDDLTHCAVANGVLACDFGSMAAGSNLTVNLILVPLTVPVDPDTFDNTATVAANELDPVLSNNSATQTVQVTGTNLTGGGALRNLPGFSNTITPPNDDDSFGPVPVGFNLNFFGTPVSSLFVNNNGNVTFGTSLGEFTPFPITTTNLQIIAPYFSDVGTYQSGSGLVTYGNDTVNGHPAFGVNWPNVDYFGEGEPPTLLNLFQLVLVDRSDVNAGDFDIELNYDKIQWETGDASGGSGGLGGTPARAGYSNGTGSSGSYFEFPGSGVSGSFLDSNPATGLIYSTLNSTQPGRYIFQVRGGVVQSSADLSIAATGPQSVVPGSTATYSITAANQGPNTATGVTVTDTLPVGLTFVSTTQGTICPTPPTPAAGQPVVVTCNVGSLASGSNINIAIQATVPPGASGVLTDTAVVSAPNNQDLNLGNNTATVVTNTNVADVAIIGAGAASPVGGFPAYAATVINNGPAAATNVVLTDELDNFGFVSASSTQGSCAFTSPTVTCSLGTLANGASAVVTVVVTAPNAGWAANTYHVSATQPDPNPINNAFRLGPSLDSFNTPVGSNVAINASDPADNLAAAVTFSSVTRVGSTTMTSMSAASLPTGFRSGRQPAFFDISTNAEFAGAIGLNIRFLPANFRHPALVRLFHFEGGVWVDRTLGLNVSSGVIASQVMSLSPFALLEPVDSLPIANAGADRSVPGAMAAGARVVLDGSASADADADPLTYRWSGPFPEGGGTVTGINPTVTLPLGVSKVALVVNDGEADSPAVAVNIAVADFQVSAPAGSVSLTRGQSTTFTITMTPQYGAFGAPINLSCAPGTADVTCSFSSASVTPGATAATATLTVTASSTVARAPRRSMPASIALWFGTLPVFGVVFLAAGRRKKWQMAVLLMLVLVLVAAHIGCGGGGTSQTQSSSSPSTPGAKAISITVTGTSGTLQRSSAVTVTIPQ